MLTVDGIDMKIGLFWEVYILLGQLIFIRVHVSHRSKVEQV